MNNKTKTITITPRVDGFLKGLKRVEYVTEGYMRAIKKFSRKTRIIRKQIIRDTNNATRRTPLIHNGKKAR